MPSALDVVVSPLFVDIQISNIRDKGIGAQPILNTGDDAIGVCHQCSGPPLGIDEKNRTEQGLLPVIGLDIPKAYTRKRTSNATQTWLQLKVVCIAP